MYPDRDRLKTGLLLAGAIGFAALGQFYFFQRREYVWDGVIFYSVALICFARLIARGARQGQAPTWRGRIRQFVGNRRAAIVGLALFLNLIVARSANVQPPPADYTFSVLLWLGSLALFFVAFVHPSPALDRSTIRSRLKNLSLTYTDRYSRTATRIARSRALQHELTLVIGLLLIGLLLRAWDLEHIPANLSGDEGTQAMWAVDALQGQLRNPFATGWFTVPTMSFFAQAASLRLFGDSVAGLRTLSALTGTATLIFTYLLARRSLGRRIALFALAALTFNHYHIHFSRLGSNQIADPLFMSLTLWLLTEGLRRARGERRGARSEGRGARGKEREAGGEGQEARNTRHTTRHSPPATRHSQHATRHSHLWFLSAGLTMGLSWYGYFGSRVIMLVVAVYLGTWAITERRFLRHHAYALTLMALMALMAALPLLLYFAHHPENFSARLNQVNFFRWLENELARPEHDSTLSLVLRQVWRSISAFNHTLDPTFWYRAQIPLLDFVSGVLFVLGLVVAFSQWRRPATRLVLIWFGLALTLGWVLTENPPSSMRMVIVAPATALLVALGLDRLLTLAHWAVGGHRALWTQIGLSLMAVVAVLNIHYYFVVYTPTRIYGNPTAETGTVLARYLANRGNQPFVYFYGPPFLYYEFGTIRFIARDVPGVSVPPIDQDPNYHTPVSEPTLFVVLRERREELAAIQARHPGGHLYEFYSETDGRLMFVVYEVLR